MLAGIRETEEFELGKSLGYFIFLPFLWSLPIHSFIFTKLSWADQILFLHHAKKHCAGSLVLLDSAAEPLACWHSDYCRENLAFCCGYNFWIRIWKFSFCSRSCHVGYKTRKCLILPTRCVLLSPFVSEFTIQSWTSCPVANFSKKEKRNWDVMSLTLMACTPVVSTSRLIALQWNFWSVDITGQEWLCELPVPTCISWLAFQSVYYQYLHTF